MPDKRLAILKEWPHYRLSIRRMAAGRNYLFLENTKTGACDYPILYPDTDRAVYDRPENWPVYVRRHIQKTAVSLRDALKYWR